MVHRHRHTSREEPAGLHDSGYVSVTETFWSVRPGAHIFVVATVSRNGGNGPRLRLSADPTGEGTTACTRAQTLDQPGHPRRPLGSGRQGYRGDRSRPHQRRARPDPDWLRLTRRPQGHRTHRAESSCAPAPPAGRGRSGLRQRP
ncbi:hypothetical protein FRAHR75_830021 [Frankia sp. Hr75.2]|nr:hypothetical protein FRAHR75_830021 [Frankia sp. Hr75.2]